MNKQSIWNVISNYKFNSLLVRNFLLILLLMTLPLIAINYIVYQQMNQTVEDEIEALNTKSLNRVSDVIDTTFKTTNRLAAQLSLQEDVRLFLLTNSMSVDKINKVQNSLNLYVNTYDYIDSIYIYSDIASSVIADHYNGPVSNFHERSWFDLYTAVQENTTFIVPRKYDDRYPYFLSLYRPVFLDDKYKLGVIVINMNIKGLRSVIGSQNEGDVEDIYIVDNQDHTILYNQDISEFQQEFQLADQDLSRSLWENEMASKTLNVNGMQYLLAKKELASQDWSVISFIPLTAYENKLKDIRRFIFIISFISVLVAMILSFFITLRTYKPLRNIMSSLETSDGWISSKETLQKNELLFIHKHISDNLQSKKLLERELEERMVLVSKAQTLALQAQINPHFLSNTLEMMKWKAMEFTGGENELSKMTVSLSVLLRLTLGTENSLIPIQMEVELDKRYIDIMKARYKKAFEIHWDIDEALLEYKTVQLTLQPIIENAIKHGIRPTKRLGRINIEIREKDNDIILTVLDDGMGIEENKVAKLNAQLKEIYNLEGKHVGIRNINQRIKLIYGEAYGVKVESERGKGTTIMVRIPKYK